MSSTLFNVTSGSIFWDKEETEVSQDELAYVNIKCVGWTAATQSLATAIILVPKYMPTDANGPTGLSTQFSNAPIQRKTSRYQEGMIRVDATYKCTVAAIINGPNGGGEEANAEEDKTSIRIAVVEQPILSHPVAMKFATEDKSMLSGLLNGYIKSGIELQSDGTPNPSGYEFVGQDADTKAYTKEAKFSETTQSATIAGVSITASPLDFARIIRSGTTTYKAPSPYFTWSGVRRVGVTGSELNKVGSIIKPSRAPAVTNREWFYEGLIEEQVTDEIYQFQREFSLSESGGALKQLYAGATGDINAV